MAEYPCGTSQTEVEDNDNSIMCDLCDKWHHTIYVDVTNTSYEKLKLDPKLWFFPTFAKEIPFFALAKILRTSNQIVFTKNQLLKC